MNSQINSGLQSFTQGKETQNECLAANLSHVQNAAINALFSGIQQGASTLNLGDTTVRTSPSDDPLVATIDPSNLGPTKPHSTTAWPEWLSRPASVIHQIWEVMLPVRTEPPAGTNALEDRFEGWNALVPSQTSQEDTTTEADPLFQAPPSPDTVNRDTTSNPPTPEELNPAPFTGKPPVIDTVVATGTDTNLIAETLALPVQAPRDEIYGHLVGSYGPDLEKTKIDTKKLEGAWPSYTFQYLLETQRTYLKALESHPETTTACRHPNCESMLEPFELDKQDLTDLAIVRHATHQMANAVQILNKMGQDADIFKEEMEKQIERLSCGQSFHFPATWLDPNGGHAMVMEIERQPDSRLTVRLYNMGAGSSHHTNLWTPREHLIVPFTEIVNIDPARLAGGAFSGFLQEVAFRYPPLDGQGWDESAFYDALLVAIGGEMSGRQVDPAMLRAPQYVGNCAMASAVAMRDKLMVTQTLAERMNFLTLMQATTAYYEHNRNTLASGALAESRRNLLLKGIKATLEQAERALESRAFIGDELTPSLEELKKLQSTITNLQTNDVGSLSHHEVDLNRLNRWRAEASSEQDFAVERIEEQRLTIPDAVVKHPILDADLDLKLSSPSTIADTLSKIVEEAQATDLSSYERRWLIKKSLLELPVSAQYWEQVPADQVNRILDAIIALQELHFLRLIEHLQESPNPAITTNDLLGILKTHTIIDTLTGEFPSELGVGIPPLLHPWLLDLLDLHEKSFTSTVTLWPKGPARHDYVLMQQHWSKKYPPGKISPNPVDLFSFTDQPMGVEVDKEVRHIPSDKKYKKHMAHVLGCDYWDQHVSFHDIEFLERWLQDHKDYADELFPELAFDPAPAKAVQILGASDTEGTPYLSRLPGLAAGLRSTMLIDAMLTTDPIEWPRLTTLKGTGYLAEHIKQPAIYTHPETGDVIDASLDYWTMTRKIGSGGSTLAKPMPHRSEKWRLSALDLPLKNSAMESVLHISKRNDAPGRGARRRLTPTAAATVTPLDLEAMFKLGTQETRELAEISTVPHLQSAEDINLFTKRLHDLLDNDRLEVLQQLLLEPGILEENLIIDPGFAAGLGRFLHRATQLTTLVEVVETTSTLASLSTSLKKTIDGIANRTSLLLDTSTFPDSGEIFDTLLQRLDPIDDAEETKLVHYYRAKSFEGQATLTPEEARQLIASIDFIEYHGLPKTYENEPRHQLNDIRETFEVLARQNLQHLLEDPDTRDTILNGAIQDLNLVAQQGRWSEHSSYPLYISPAEETIYDARTGRFNRMSEGLVKIPRELTEDPTFANLLGGKVTHVEKIGATHYLCNNRETGETYRLVTENAPPVVQRKIERRWFQAVSPTRVFDTLPFHVEQHESSPKSGLIWIPTEADPQQAKKILYYSEPGGRLLLAITGQSTVNSALDKLLNILTGPTVVEWRANSVQNNQHYLVDPSSTALSATIARFEEPSFTYYFGFRNRIQKVDLPRYNLTFRSSTDTVTGRSYLASSDLGGFGITEGGQQYLSLLCDHSKYLLLRRPRADGSYDSAILVPKLPFADQKANGLDTPTALHPLRDSWEEKGAYTLYILKDNTLNPVVSSAGEEILANTELATLFLSERKYREAALYLDRADKGLKTSKDPTTEEQASALKTLATFMAFNKDRSPDAAAIRIRARGILERQIALNRMPNDEEFFQKQYLHQDSRTNRIHAHRIDASLQLSKDMFGAVIPPRQVGATTLPPIETNSYSVAPLKGVTFEGPTYLPKHPAIIPQPGPISEKMSAGAAIATKNPIFTKAFPEYILPLYALLYDPAEIRAYEAKEVASHLGLDPDLDKEEIRASATTFVELRYRYLSNNLLKDLEDLSKSERLDLEAELHLLAVLVNAARGAGLPVASAESKARRHKDLTAALRANANFQAQMDGLEKLKDLQNEAALDEAKDIWNEWVAPHALPVPLRLDQAAEMLYRPIGPHALERMVAPPTFDPSKAIRSRPDLKIESDHPRSVVLTLPTDPSSSFDQAFYSTPIARSFPKSPFKTKDAEDEAITALFRKLDSQYREYSDRQESIDYDYAIRNPGVLDRLRNSLEMRSEVAGAAITSTKQRIIKALNVLPEDPSLRNHAKARILRGAQRPLAVSDAKVAIARGWDYSFLQALNPILTKEDIDRLFRNTLQLMLVTREQQRVQRSLKAIDAIDPQRSLSEVDFQESVKNLKVALSERLHYNPVEDPLLLLAETELNIGFWEAQVPAIQQLAPKDQVAALVQLEMGLGKTDVITPVVLGILADGDTLPILVMPEALIPSMAPRLQKRLGKAFDTEIRVVPIMRDHRTAAEVTRLRKELTTMMALRTPLIWSSMDMQTLINSFVEDLDRVGSGELDGEAARKLIAEWQSLLTFLRTSTEIIGDEIHAILDILTSYNFSLGEPKKLTNDEMDAVVEFFRIILEHPEIAHNTQFPFLKESKGQPLTEEHFKSVIAPQIVESIITRGVTNDDECIEFLEKLSEESLDVIRGYLSSNPSVTIDDIKAIHFPKISKADIAHLREMKTGAVDSHVQSLLAKLLPRDLLMTRHLYSNLPLDQFLDKIEDLRKKYDALTERLHNFLAVQKESLRIVFPLAASAQLGKHYAANRAGDAAIPADEGTPQWDSLFGSSLERLFYTSLLFLQEDIPVEIIRSDLDRFVEGIQSEVVQNKLIDPERSQWIASFRSRYGDAIPLSPSGFTDRQVLLLTDWINGNSLRRLPIIRDHYLEKTEIYRKEIESSTHMFPLISRPNIGLKGMSGTLPNKDTFPAVFDRIAASDTIAAVVHRIKDVAPNKVTTVTFGSSAKETLDSLNSNIARGPACIIDTTGHIGKSETPAFAKEMLNRAHAANNQVKGVVYYENDNPKVLIHGREEPVLYDKKHDPNELIALWDVSHTTGADIRLGTTDAVLIVGRHIRLFELAQAAMRLRRLGKGQRLEFVVPEGHQQVIADTLRKHLDIDLNDEEPLTVDLIIQYAALNEHLQETENNYRALDMRMRMALLAPIMDLLRTPEIPPEHVAEAYAAASPLFIKEHAASPQDLYGAPIFKVDIERGIADKLAFWLQHPVLATIERKQDLFPNIDTDAIRAEFRQIAESGRGPLRHEVDTTTYIGNKQKTLSKMAVKQLKVKAQTKEQVKTQEKLEVRKRDVYSHKRGELRPLRRGPYPPRAVIPVPSNPFLHAAQKPLPLTTATALNGDVLTRNIEEGASSHWTLEAGQVLSLDKLLSKALRIDDNRIRFSLNLAPVWKSATSAPSYAPYDYFQKMPSHALVAQDIATGELTVTLVDTNDTVMLARKLKDDREHPELFTDKTVRLGLYHLGEDRFVAHGADRIDLSLFPESDKDYLSLLTQAKLLAGLTGYSKEELGALGQWAQHRNPNHVLQAFVTRLGRHLDVTVENLHASDLGRLFKDLGVQDSELEDARRHLLLATHDIVQQLLYDRALTQDGRIELMALLEKKVSEDPSELLGDWSNHVAALLPLLFEVRGIDGASIRPDHSMLGPDKELRPSAFIRRWLMNTFFPTLADEYAAWKSAIPPMQLRIDDLETHELIRIAADATDDPDATRLEHDISTSSRADRTKLEADVSQLEAMSELAHPLWGLPRLTQVGDELRTTIHATVSDIGLNTLTPSLARALSTPAAPINADISAKIAQHAIETIDLPKSLSSLFRINKSYPFENLYGLFAFLALRDTDGEARTRYAEHLLPRFFGMKLKDDTVYYSKFIAESLLIHPEIFEEKEIAALLDRCNNAVNLVSRTPSKGTDPSVHWREPSWNEMIDTLNRLTRDASSDQAKISANWLNGALLDAPTRSWFLEGLIYRLMARPEALINHKAFGVFLEKTHNTANVLKGLIDEADVTSYSRTEVDAITSLGFRDWTLIAEITDLNLVNRPRMTGPQVAALLEKSLEDLDDNRILAAAESTLLRRVLNDISKRLPDTLTEYDKVALRNLLKVVDRLSANGGWDSFVEIQKQSAPLRSVAYYSSDPATRQQEGLNEIEKLISKQYDGYQAVIQTLFIKDWLMPLPETVSPGTITELLDLAYTHGTRTPRPFKTWGSKEHWPISPHWDDIGSTFTAFTTHGTSEQQQATYDWIHKQLDGKKESIQSPPWILDAMIIQSIAADQSQVEYDRLVAYCRDRKDAPATTATSADRYLHSTRTLIADLGDREGVVVKDWYRGDQKERARYGPWIAAIAGADFELFAELGDLKLKGQKPLPAAALAEKLTTSIPKNLRLHRENAQNSKEAINRDIILRGLDKILQRTGTPRVNDPVRTAASALVKALEGQIPTTDDLQHLHSFVSRINRLRWASDFIDHPSKTNENLAKAAQEMVTTSPTNAIRKALYRHFIPHTLKSRILTDDTSWIAATLNAALEKAEELEQSPNEFESPDLSVAKFLIDALDMDAHRESFATAIRDLLTQRARSWLLDELVIHIATKDPSLLDYESLASYIGDDVTFRERVVKDVLNRHDAELVNSYGNAPLHVIFDLFNIPISNRPLASSDSLAEAITAHHPDFTEKTDSDVAFLTRNLQAINERMPRDYVAEKYLPVLETIKSHIIGTQSAKLDEVTNALRMKILFQGTAVDNLYDALAMQDELLAMPAFKRSVEEELLPSALDAAPALTLSLMHNYCLQHRFSSESVQWVQNVVTQAAFMGSQANRSALDRFIIKSLTQNPHELPYYKPLIQKLAQAQRIPYSVLNEYWPTLSIEERAELVSGLPRSSSVRLEEWQLYVLLKLAGDNLALASNLLRVSISGVRHGSREELYIQLPTLLSGLQGPDTLNDMAILLDIAVDRLPTFFFTQLKDTEKEALRTLITVAEISIRKAFADDRTLRKTLSQLKRWT